jgi:hypothetical protein
MLESFDRRSEVDAFPASSSVGIDCTASGGIAERVLRA